MSGVVVVVNRDSSPAKHAGINVIVEGSVNLQLSARSVGIFEAFYSSVKPQPLVYYEIPVTPAGKVVRCTVMQMRYLLLSISSLLIDKKCLCQNQFGVSGF